MSLLSELFQLFMHLYRLLISPLMPVACRFEPTCSAYGLQALKCHGPVKGTWLTLRRVLRCNPWGGKGYDPVPPSPDTAEHNPH